MTIQRGRVEAAQGRVGVERQQHRDTVPQIRRHREKGTGARGHGGVEIQCRHNAMQAWDIRHGSMATMMAVAQSLAVHDNQAPCSQQQTSASLLETSLHIRNSSRPASQRWWKITRSDSMTQHCVDVGGATVFRGQWSQCMSGMSVVRHL